jgi:hypothetical protein
LVEHRGDCAVRGALMVSIERVENLIHREG